MPLVEIPPHVLLDEDPPGREGDLRTFHRQSYQLVDPIDFPRELFAAALEAHGRLLDAHLPEILEAPYDHPTRKLAERFASPDRLYWCTTILAADGPAHEVHKWETVDASYVVQAYRGVLRRLTEVPPQGTHHVVVLTRDAVSLHLLRVVAPRRVGDAARLEVAERDLVVEPREQWHERDAYHVRTWWKTPAGDLVASRASVRPWPRNAREKVEAILALREASLRARIAAYREKNAKQPQAQREAPLAVIDPGHRGEDLDVVPFSFKGIWLAGQPAIEDALKTPRAGLVPVLVPGHRWTALAWLPNDPQAGVVVPKLLLEKETPGPEDDDYEPPPPAKKEPGVRPGAARPRPALDGDLAPPEPWAPASRDVHAVWSAGLCVAVCLVAASLGWWHLAVDFRRFDGFDRIVVLVGVPFATGFLAYGLWLFRRAWRAIDPARRKQRWELSHPIAVEPPAPPPDPDELHRREWMRRLGRRLSRFERLVDLGAPQVIIDDGRRMIHEALAEVEKEDGEAVMADFPRAESLLATNEEKRAAAARARAKSKAN
jgi:hypothetical protein